MQHWEESVDKADSWTIGFYLHQCRCQETCDSTLALETRKDYFRSHYTQKLLTNKITVQISMLILEDFFLNFPFVKYVFCFLARNPVSLAAQFYAAKNDSITVEFTALIGAGLIRNCVE